MENTTQLCTFELDGLLFGMDVLFIQEVIRCPNLAPVPLAPSTIEGLLNLRGQILTAIDLRVRLGLEERDAESSSPMLIIARAKTGESAFVVDSVGEVIEVSADTFEPAPSNVPEDIGEFLKGVHKLEHRLLHVLDADSTASFLSHDLQV
ncbi:hypothetical protein VDG1235_4346 [Verrucomicrobiia bacterium DG1235]|nr:hypothetical protein VDG1235_4346 [Verrucomicrobiae bacterium DG1235]